MKSPTIVAVATTLIVAVLAWEVFSAPFDKCPSCEEAKKNNDSPVCAQEETEFQGSFQNFCEMLRFNCKNNRRYYVVKVGERCDTDQAWTKKHNVDKPIVPKKT